MRPEASYRYQCLGLGSAPRLTPPTDLSQALLNLLNNAADACPDDLDIRLDWDSSSICLSIRDHGVGVPWRSPNRSANRSSPPRARASASACFSVRPA